MNGATEKNDLEKENEELRKKLEKEKQEKERLARELVMQRNVGYYDQPLIDPFYLPSYPNFSICHHTKDEDSNVTAGNKMSEGHYESNEHSAPTTFTNHAKQIETANEIESFPATAETPILSQPTHSFGIGDLTTNLGDGTNDVTTNLSDTVGSAVKMINSTAAPSNSLPDIRIDDSTEDCCFLCDICSSCDDD